ncbi:glucans biosynthesis glucosyltransferase MdoH [Pseudoroseicyclus tamaricis]|uniref:Glucans biosynthesis glucosyltransferase H n=1 Tax=Pseudoroseicyclus tamaricis TaxID=2705421 RepID=A0A6B2JRK9_9RHOB|nr:glucans biosynthesis glucosyltransferase MdoH [Pseudoroseicyclus tamaricis]NDV01207.1 glucans biosynthesis glucosyltransferase MdoH [Pseudoroseicyclus tamaricis]
MRNAPAASHSARTALTRLVALGFAAICGLGAAAILAQAAAVDHFSVWDGLCVALILLTTTWLAWGAAQVLVGLPPRRSAPARTASEPMGRAVLLLPICHEEPGPVFARVAAMDASAREAGLDLDIAVLSDTRDGIASRRETAAFAMLLERTGGVGRIFYRRRTDNRGRKAGNVEDFIRRSGAAYDYALILDADSLMEGATIRQMILRMDADPDLGLLQTLPRITGARSIFGRAMQFSAGFYSPVFARGLARMQGSAGPFWGHNAIVRVRAMAECCGLPVLSGRPPFGGTILSHDYVEAALLARGGWRVEVDDRLGGSYEEGPEDIVAYARRDRRWCQGNLQHIRLIFAPGLKPWSRFVFLQGILAYLVAIFWGAFLAASVLATITSPAPNYFPEAYNLFPAFPADRTSRIVGLAAGIGGLLFLPKIAIHLGAALSGRSRAFGGALRALASMLAEVLLSTLIAPLMLVYQSRAVGEVLAGHDGGWPATPRDGARMTLADGWVAGRRITAWGVALIAAAVHLAPTLAPWLLPVALPMMAAPLLIAWTSAPAPRWLFRVPEEGDVPPVVARYRAQLDRWGAAPAHDHAAEAGSHAAI